MKNLPTYEQFNEQYLPYFGVKQALDDSKKPLVKEEHKNFTRIFSMTSTWWNAWRRENEGFLDIDHDAFNKTYEVSKNGKTLFIFDYGRNKIFTNESPSMFIIKNPISPEVLDKLKDKKVEDPEGKIPDPAEEATKKSEE